MAEEQFPSIRNLVDSDIGPLRRFTGILDSLPREDRVFNEGEANERKSKSMTMNFREIEVLEAVEPYQLPVYSITFTESNKKKSKYGVMGLSAQEVIDMQYTPAQLDPSSPDYVPPSKRMDLKDLVGKRLGMVVADGEEGRPPLHELFDGRQGKDAPTPTWEVYMIEGIGVKGAANVSPMEKAMQLLDGKTKEEFNAAALADDVVRSDMNLLTSIGLADSAPNSFTNTMLNSGAFTKDEQGKFHRVQG